MGLGTRIGKRESKGTKQKDKELGMDGSEKHRLVWERLEVIRKTRNEDWDLVIVVGLKLGSWTGMVQEKLGNSTSWALGRGLGSRWLWKGWGRRNE